MRIILQHHRSFEWQSYLLLNKWKLKQDYILKLSPSSSSLSSSSWACFSLIRSHHHHHQQQHHHHHHLGLPYTHYHLSNLASSRARDVVRGGLNRHFFMACQSVSLSSFSNGGSGGSNGSDGFTGSGNDSSNSSSSGDGGGKDISKNRGNSLINADGSKADSSKSKIAEGRDDMPKDKDKDKDKRMELNGTKISSTKDQNGSFPSSQNESSNEISSPSLSQTNIEIVSSLSKLGISRTPPEKYVAGDTFIHSLTGEKMIIFGEVSLNVVRYYDPTNINDAEKVSIPEDSENTSKPVTTLGKELQGELAALESESVKTIPSPELPQLNKLRLGPRSSNKETFYLAAGKRSKSVLLVAHKDVVPFISFSDNPVPDVASYFHAELIKKTAQRSPSVSSDLLEQLPSTLKTYFGDFFNVNKEGDLLIKREDVSLFLSRLVSSSVPLRPSQHLRYRLAVRRILSNRYKKIRELEEEEDNEGAEGEMSISKLWGEAEEKSSTQETSNDSGTITSQYSSVTPSKESSGSHLSDYSDGLSLYKFSPKEPIFSHFLTTMQTRLEKSSMFIKDTHGVRVSVVPLFTEHRQNNRYLFTLTITIQNMTSRRIQLWRRRWVLRDPKAVEPIRFISGLGIAGQQPILQSPNEPAHIYEVAADFEGLSAEMGGSYEFIDLDTNEYFLVDIPLILLKGWENPK